MACSAVLLPSTTKCGCLLFEPLKWDGSKCGACLHEARSHKISEYKDSAKPKMAPRTPKRYDKSQEWMQGLDIAHTMDIAKIEKIFNNFDQDKNGYLDRNEARMFVEQWCLQMGSHEPVNVTRALELFFDTFDADKDGRITKAELLGNKTESLDLLPHANPDLLLQPSKAEDSDGEGDSQPSESLLDIETKAESGIIQGFELGPTIARLTTMGGENLELFQQLRDFQSWLPDIEAALKADTVDALSKAIKKAEDFNVNQEPHEKFKAARMRLKELEGTHTEVKEAKPDAAKAWAALTAEEVAKKVDTQSKVFKEILSTEEKYLACLQILTEQWLTPLKEPAQAAYLNNMQLKALQLNLQTLEPLHAQICERLKADCTQAPKIFIEYGEYFAVYKQYLSGYDGLITAMHQLSTCVPFQKFLSKVKQNLASCHNGLDLMSYLIMPVQRLPRYVLLLKELARNTDPKTPAYADIQKALTKISAITLSINEAKRHVEAMSRVLGVQQRLQNCKISLLVPHRRLLKEGELVEYQEAKRNVISPHAKKPPVKKHRRVFLFNDILLWASHDYVFRGMFNLAVCEIAPDLNNMKCVISVGRNSLELHSPVIDEIEAWIHDLLQAHGVAHALKLEQARHSGVLTLHFNRAEHLPIGDVFTRSSDPYVKFHGHDGKELRTKIINQNLNPVWEETFHLPFPVPPRSIELQIWDKDQIVDDFLCQTTVPIGPAILEERVITEFQAQDGSPMKNHNIKLVIQVGWRLNSELESN